MQQMGEKFPEEIDEFVFAGQEHPVDEASIGLVVRGTTSAAALEEPLTALVSCWRSVTMLLRRWVVVRARPSLFKWLLCMIFNQ